MKRYLLSPRKEWLRFDSIFMVSGIILSVAVLTVSLSIFDGYERALKKVILSANSHIYFFKSGSDELSPADIERIKSTLDGKKEVVATAEIVLTQAMLAKNNRIKGVLVRGINWQQKEQPTEYHHYVKKGTYKLTDKYDIVVAEKIAQLLNISCGDTIKLISPANTSFTALGLKNKSHTFRVVGIYSSGMYEYDMQYVFVNSEIAMEFAKLKDKYTMLEVKLAPEYIDKADYLAYLWESEFDNDYQIRSWIEFNGNLFSLLKLEKWVIFIILSFLVLIASFNVISAVSTSIIEKRKEIGIIKAIGASNKLLRRIFTIKMLVISSLAIVSGEIIGILFSVIIAKQHFFVLKGDVYFLDKINVVFLPMNMAIIFGVSILIVLSSILLPLRKINKMEITEIIR